MTQRYAHLAPKHLQTAVRSLDGGCSQKRRRPGTDGIYKDGFRFSVSGSGNALYRASLSILRLPITRIGVAGHSAEVTVRG